MDERVELLSLELPCDFNAPASVRRALEKLDLVGLMISDVMLVASELVANAVRHSGCTPDHTVRVTAGLGSESVWISIWDPGLTGHSAEIRQANDVADGGLGLMLVSQLADKWGTERTDGYRVWAEMALPQSSPG